MTRKLEKHLISMYFTLRPEYSCYAALGSCTTPAMPSLHYTPHASPLQNTLRGTSLLNDRTPQNHMLRTTFEILTPPLLPPFDQSTAHFYTTLPRKECDAEHHTLNGPLHTHPSRSMITVATINEKRARALKSCTSLSWTRRNGRSPTTDTQHVAT